MEVDFDRISKLLSVVEKIPSVAPGFTYISTEAMAELREINEGIRKAGEEKRGAPVTPASIGDAESPAQPIPAGGSAPDFDQHPEASKPVDDSVKVDAPAVTAPAPSSEAGGGQSPSPAPAAETTDDSEQKAMEAPAPVVTPIPTLEPPPPQAEPDHSVDQTQDPPKNPPLPFEEAKADPAPVADSVRRV